MNKSNKYGYHYTLKSPQYENCQVLNPDNELMFRCCKRKADWYLNRNLAVKVQDDPLTIRLNFIPKGVGRINDPYHLQEMKNRCVVCGSEDNLTRHHIVPISYRRFFPLNLKNHNSYDVMALCIPCHRTYEDYALVVKQDLAHKYAIPLSGKGIEYNKDIAKIKGAASALKNHKHKMPPSRIAELNDKIKDHLGREPNDLDINELANIELYN